MSIFFSTIFIIVITITITISVTISIILECCHLYGHAAQQVSNPEGWQQLCRKASDWLPLAAASFPKLWKAPYHSNIRNNCIIIIVAKIVL